MKYLIMVGVVFGLALLFLGTGDDTPSYAEVRRAEIELERLETDADLYQAWAPFRAGVVNVAFAGLVIGGSGLALLAGWSLVARLLLPASRADGPLLLVQPERGAFDTSHDLALYDE